MFANQINVTAPEEHSKCIDLGVIPKQTNIYTSLVQYYLAYVNKQRVEYVSVHTRDECGFTSHLRMLDAESWALIGHGLKHFLDQCYYTN